MRFAILVILVACTEASSPPPTDHLGTSVDAESVAETTVPGIDANATDAVDTTGPACEPAAPALSSLRLTLDGTRIRDVLGREVLLRGINTGGRSKFPPYLGFAFAESGLPSHASRPPFDEALAAYVERAAAWGLNVVRLPVTWEALEPTRGTYDEAFLTRFEAVATAFGARGIRVIVDVHQDVFGRAYCGDGFPTWALPEPKALPTESCAQWFNGYTSSKEVKAAFDRFWNNEDGLRDSFEDLWRHLAARMAPIDAVVAFEILNEPGWGTADSNVFLPTVLTPFYTQLAAVIREVAPGIPVLFDSTGLDAVIGKTKLALPDGENLIFAPHYYDPTVITSGRWLTEDADYTALIGQWRDQGLAWNLPILLGEFGIRATATKGEGYLRRNLEALDALLMHGTVWEYSDAPEDWNGEGMSVLDTTGQETPLVSALVRVYPAAVPGTLESFTFDATTRDATLTFTATAGIAEVVAPGRLYPEAPRIDVDGVPGCSRWDAATGRVFVSVPEAGPVKIRIRPGQPTP